MLVTDTLTALAVLHVTVAVAGDVAEVGFTDIEALTDPGGADPTLTVTDLTTGPPGPSAVTVYV